MNIVVKKLGDSGKVMTLHVEAADRIEDVKEMIARQEGVQPYRQRLIFCGRPLSDGNTLYDHSITTNATIYLQVRPEELDKNLANYYLENSEVPVADTTLEPLKSVPLCCHATNAINAAL
jgi:ubiquitin